MDKNSLGHKEGHLENAQNQFGKEDKSTCKTGLIKLEYGPNQLGKWANVFGKWAKSTQKMETLKFVNYN